jgi:two-component system, OmpR family, sensor histidine kinase BaeS
MFRTLRQRLIWSQILPLLVALPLMGLMLAYTLEEQIIIPQLAKNLVGNARLLAEITTAEYELWGDPLLFRRLISRVQFDPSIQVMFLDGQGDLLYSSDSNDSALLGRNLALPGIESSQAGQETALTNYSLFNLNNVVVDVYEPISDVRGEVIGIIRLTYRVGSIYEIFSQLRWEILIALAFGLVVSFVMGTWLVISISRPVKDVTEAIYGLATGQRQELVSETGPEELRSQARAVNFLVDQLHSLETSRRQLLANLVHELGRPLGALRSAIHALQQGASGDPVLLSDLTRGMDEETHRLQFLLDELANLYDRSTGSLELDRRWVETGDWLRGVLAPWHASADEKGLQWNEDIPAGIPAVFLDPNRMAQVIENLVNNAIKYTPSGGRVDISAGVNDENFWVKVRDSGPGILPEEQDKIFLPYYRGDTGRRIKQGMGLGLTIARELVTAHDGHIQVESVRGEGSEFLVTLPLAIEAVSTHGEGRISS